MYVYCIYQDESPWLGKLGMSGFGSGIRQSEEVTTRLNVNLIFILFLYSPHTPSCSQRKCYGSALPRDVTSLPPAPQRESQRTAVTRGQRGLSKTDREIGKKTSGDPAVISVQTCSVMSASILGADRMFQQKLNTHSLR